MIEIPDPPPQPVCATCGHVSWLYSAKSRAWICVVPVDTTTFRLHECRHAQDRGTWKALSAVPDPGQADINAAGRAAVEAALKTRTEGDETR